MMAVPNSEDSRIIEDSSGARVIFWDLWGGIEPQAHCQGNPSGETLSET